MHRIVTTINRQGTKGDARTQSAKCVPFSQNQEHQSIKQLEKRAHNKEEKSVELEMCFLTVPSNGFRHQDQLSYFGDP